MKHLLFFFLFINGFLTIHAQDNFQNEIRVALQEGKTICRLEQANRQAEKLFREKYQGKQTIDGFIVYPEGEKVKAVFYGNGDKINVVGTVVYAQEIDDKAAQVDFQERGLTGAETDVYKLKNAAWTAVNDAASFSVLPGTRFTVVPMFVNGARRAIVLTVPEKKGSVIFGNDYQLSFDNTFKLTDKTAFHKALATVTYEPGGGPSNDKGSSHIHIPSRGDMITSTDVAILYLFHDATEWTHHTFIGENYLFLFSYRGPDIQVIPKGVPKMK